MIRFKIDKTLVAFAIIYTFALLLTINNPHHVDESTHSFVGLVLKDFSNDLIKTPTLSYDKIYDYLNSYLVYYPKISLHYPPLPQFLFSMAYNIFGASLQVSRLVIILTSLALLLTVYSFTNIIFRSRIVSFIAASLLMTAPIIINMSILAMQEMPFVFFFTLTMMWLYLIKGRKPEIRNFLILSVLMALTTLTKWQAITIFPTILLYILVFERRLLRYILFSLVISTALLMPYYLLLWKANLLLLPLSVNLEADPLDPTWMQPEGWFYYLSAFVKDQFFLPIGILIALATFAYFSNKERDWKFFATWILVVYLIMTIVHNKDVRYTLNFLPAFVIPGAYILHKVLKKIINIHTLLTLIIALALIQYVVSFTNLIYGFPEVEGVAKYILEDNSGNILINIGLGTASPFIFEIARNSNFEHQVLRPCTIESLNESYGVLMRKFGIKYIVVDEDRQGFKEKQNDFMKYIDENEAFVKVKGFSRFSVIKNNDYSAEEKADLCNYVCATREIVCTKFKIPQDALK